MASLFNALFSTLILWLSFRFSIFSHHPLATYNQTFQAGILINVLFCLLSDDVKGIPEFWLTAMKNVDMLAEMILVCGFFQYTIHCNQTC